MRWVHDWPVIGIDVDGDGKGEPVLSYEKPNVGGGPGRGAKTGAAVKMDREATVGATGAIGNREGYPIMAPQESDEFNGDSLDGVSYTSIGEPFYAKPDKWIGAKVGLFCLSPVDAKNGGYADVDWFHIELALPSAGTKNRKKNDHEKIDAITDLHATDRRTLCTRGQPGNVGGRSYPGSNPYKTSFT